MLSLRRQKKQRRQQRLWLSFEAACLPAKRFPEPILKAVVCYCGKGSCFCDAASVNITALQSSTFVNPYNLAASKI